MDRFNELEGVWLEEVVVEFKVLSRHLMTKTTVTIVYIQAKIWNTDLRNKKQ